MTAFTARDKQRCADREVALRVNFYKKKIAAGQMTRRAADREVDMMREIAEDYRRLADDEESKGRLKP